MAQIRAVSDTVLKQFPLDSSRLEQQQLKPVPQGTTLSVERCGPSSGNHTLYKASNGLWWAFDSHWSEVGRPSSSDNRWFDDRCLALVQEFEGFVGRAMVPVPGDPWTVGYGMTVWPDGRPVREGDVIGQEQATQILEEQLASYANRARALVTVPVTKGMASAITSFTYNLGTAAFEGSTLRILLNKGDYAGAAKEFDRWIYAGGVVYEGLRRRRNAEEKLFLADGFPAGVAPVVDSADFNAHISKYFTFGEMYCYDKRRITRDPLLLHNMTQLCQRLDAVREKWGPLQVNSGYRPVQINREVGGVESSYHVRGMAADVYCLQADIYEFQDWCIKNWKGGVGRGAPHFVHLDIGPAGRVWDYGS